MTRPTPRQEMQPTLPSPSPSQLPLPFGRPPSRAAKFFTDDSDSDVKYHDSDHSHAHGHAAMSRDLASAPADTSSPALIRNRSSSDFNLTAAERKRRGSHDGFAVNRKFMINVNETKRKLLEQEDTDGDWQVTVVDMGPKTLPIGTANSFGHNKVEVRGHYAISNLLQELALAADHGRNVILLEEQRLLENPVDRLKRLIKYHFWDGLTRRIDADCLEAICADPKNSAADGKNRIYVPHNDKFALEYYTEVAKTRPHLNLVVERLPLEITSTYVKTLHKFPGILSLALRRDPRTKKTRGAPFVVPGGRFNEMYGWDSYFETLGLVVDGRVRLGHAMVDNFVYEIEHYGKILNANRSYYLTRSQPPFLTDMIWTVFRAIADAGFGENSTDTDERPLTAEEIEASGMFPQSALELNVWTARGLRAAVKELFSVWLGTERFDNWSGLLRYRPDCVGVPPETEEGHFDSVLQPKADAHGLELRDFERRYECGEIKDSELDEYFVHDGAVRESGHDTSYRFDNTCADLATVDLNCLIYKYQSDLEHILNNHFDGSITFSVRRGESDVYLESFRAWLAVLLDRDVEGLVGQNGGWNTTWSRGLMVYDTKIDNFYREKGIQRPTVTKRALPTYSLPSPDSPHFTVTIPSYLFSRLAKRTRDLVNKHLWSPELNMYMDKNTRTKVLAPYRSATTLYALWSGLATQEQAKLIVDHALPMFEVSGGLVAGTEESRGAISSARPQRQWDFPFGWAPHQMLAWNGLARYGFGEKAARLAYRWLFTITQSFVDFNGVVPEKFDVVNVTHRVNVEYGNVGSDFKEVVREGFGWMNASFQVGLGYLTPHMKRALGALTPPDQLFAALDRAASPPKN